MWVITLKREYPRVEAEFYLNKIVDGIPYLVRCKDLSLGGIYVHRLLEPCFRSNATVAVEFSLPNSSDVLRADVEPVWESGSGGFGLRFRGLTPRVHRHVQEYIQYHQVVTAISD